MDDARPAFPHRHAPIPLMSLTPAALLPAWWEPAITVLTLAGLACLAAAFLLAVRSRARDPWHRVARASAARDAAERNAARLVPPAPDVLPAALPVVPRPAAAASPAAPTPGLSPVALHVVTGAERDAIVRGVVEAAAQLLARGGPVLVIDAGRRLDLHLAFGGEARWGAGECLEGRLPLLGVVQSTGHRGLLLLARGSADVTAPWRAFGRLLDEASAAFPRVVVALDTDCPPEAAPAFGPREIEGWWAGDGSLPRSGHAFVERVGIPLRALAVPASLDSLLEGLPRAAATSPARAERAAAAPSRIPEPVPAEAPAAAAVVATAPIGTPCGLVEAGEPVAPLVLPCDARVAERLRFLNWARRLHRERVPAMAREAAEPLELAGASS